MRAAGCDPNTGKPLVGVGVRTPIVTSSKKTATPSFVRRKELEALVTALGQHLGLRDRRIEELEKRISKLESKPRLKYADWMLTMKKEKDSSR